MLIIFSKRCTRDNVGFFPSRDFSLCKRGKCQVRTCQSVESTGKANERQADKLYVLTRVKKKMPSEISLTNEKKEV